MLTRRRALVSIALALPFVGWGGIGLSRRVRAARFVSGLSAGGLEAGGEGEVTRFDVTIENGAAPAIRARVYHPAGGGRSPGVVVAHGVHYRGIDEARLVPFARALAATGRVVLTPELRDLTDYRITEQGKEVILQSVRWLSARSDLVEGPRVGVLGFSFAGGLALVAASSPELAGRLEFVTSVGGHHDLSRVLRFLLTDRIEAPSGKVVSRAHEYGLLVLLYQYLERFVVDEPERRVLGEVLRSWLHEDRPKARARAAELGTETRRLFRLLEEGRLKAIAPDLERHVLSDAPKLRALSPNGRLSKIDVPVYLLHGAGDSVIPSSETEWAARELEHRPHDALISPLIEHVEVNRRARLLDELALVEFLAHLF